MKRKEQVTNYDIETIKKSKEENEETCGNYLFNEKDFFFFPFKFF
jgi:hypothetical protein